MVTTKIIHLVGQTQQPQQLPAPCVPPPHPSVLQLLSFFTVSHQVTSSCHHSTPCMVYFYFVLSTLVTPLTFLPVLLPLPQGCAWPCDHTLQHHRHQGHKYRAPLSSDRLTAVFLAGTCLRKPEAWPRCRD